MEDLIFMFQEKGSDLRLGSRKMPPETKHYLNHFQLLVPSHWGNMICLYKISLRHWQNCSLRSQRIKFKIINKRQGYCQEACFLQSNIQIRSYTPTKAICIDN